MKEGTRVVDIDSVENQTNDSRGGVVELSESIVEIRPPDSVDETLNVVSTSVCAE